MARTSNPHLCAATFIQPVSHSDEKVYPFTTRDVSGWYDLYFSEYVEDGYSEVYPKIRTMQTGPDPLWTSKVFIPHTYAWNIKKHV